MRYKNESQKSSEASRKPITSDTKLVPYWILVGVRVLLTFLPQTGYIHPDEYFQSIEVIAGDRFDVDVYKPWEFNVSFPLRNAIFPSLIVGLPYAILNTISPYYFYLFGATPRSPYFLVLLPRLTMCVLSFISDYCLYKICLIHKKSYKSKLIILGSSYVMLTYATRTFSNSIELILASLLLYYVSRSMAISEKIVFQSDYLSEKYAKASTIVERVKYYKLRALLPSHSLNHCFTLATISVAGIFNRPTFIAFAFPPIFFWLQRGLGSKSVGFIDFHVRMIAFVMCGIPTAILFVLIDSFYFGYLTLGEIWSLDITMNNFVVTPLNFLRYNSQAKNLKSHGLHPRFLHFMINIPLLYNVLGVIALISLSRMINSGMKGKWLELPRAQSVNALMIASFVIPVAMLSLFPHQEPRFLIPVTLPLIFLYAQNVRPVSDADAVAHVDKNVRKHQTRRDNDNKIGKIQTAWYVCNAILAIFYGFGHQGGVFPLTSHFAAELKAKPHHTHVHLFTSHTYPIPTALLQLRNTRKTYVTSEKHRYRLTKDFYLYEEGSRSVAKIYDAIDSKVRQCEENYELKKLPYRIYYALPLSFFDEFTEYTLDRNRTLPFSYRVVKRFYPHISLERIPLTGIVNNCTMLNNIEVCVKQIIENGTNNLFKLVQQMGLILLKIDSSSPSIKKLL